MREVEKKVDDFHQKIIDEHRRAREAKKTRRSSLDDDDDGKEEMDFVDVLLSLPGENGKEHMDDMEIKALMQVICSCYIATLKFNSVR
jgi:hypothetical protein